NDRYADFAANLRATLAQTYHGTRVTVLERSLLTPLLEEVRLSVAGMTQDGGGPVRTAPAVVFVDGVYQSYQDAETKVNLVLRVERSGGRLHSFSFKAKP